MKTLFLIFSALIIIYSAVPYVRDILKGKSKPNLVSWVTWTLLTGIATAAELSAHEYVAAIFTGAAVVETLAVVIMGLRHGYVRYTSFDVVCQLAAIVGIILWQIYNSPAIGVLACVAIDFIGALPTLRHSWLKPQEETWSTYGWAAVSGAFGIAALNHYSLTTLPYPIYILVIDLVIAAVILARRRIA